MTSTRCVFNGLGGGSGDVLLYSKYVARTRYGTCSVFYSVRRADVGGSGGIG